MAPVSQPYRPFSSKEVKSDSVLESLLTLQQAIALLYIDSTLLSNVPPIRNARRAKRAAGVELTRAGRGGSLRRFAPPPECFSRAWCEAGLVGAGFGSST